MWTSCFLLASEGKMTVESVFASFSISTANGCVIPSVLVCSALRLVGCNPSKETLNEIQGSLTLEDFRDFSQKLTRCDDTSSLTNRLDPEGTGFVSRQEIIELLQSGTDPLVGDALARAVLVLENDQRGGNIAVQHLHASLTNVAALQDSMIVDITTAEDQDRATVDFTESAARSTIVAHRQEFRRVTEKEEIPRVEKPSVATATTVQASAQSASTVSSTILRQAAVVPEKKMQPPPKTKSGCC